MNPSSDPNAARVVERDPIHVRPAALVAVVLFVVAAASCGGELEPSARPGCELPDGRVEPCHEGVYVFTSVDGAVLGDDCARASCPFEARCAVFDVTGATYGVCRP